MRGPVLERWVERRGRQLDEAYCQQIVRSLASPLKSPQSPSFTAPGALRQILFIADCMWETDDLLPEFARIAETRVLDLQPFFKKRAPDQPLNAVTLETVKRFAATEPGLAPDVILFYARPNLLSDEVFDLLRRKWKCPLLGMNHDDKVQFFPYGIFAGGDDNYQHWARKFDLNITDTLAATDWYTAAGLPWHYMPPGVHQPDGLGPPNSANFQYDFSFLGSKRRERSLIVEHLQRVGISINLFGGGWPNGKWVEKREPIYRNSQINLGLGLASSSFTLTSLKGRDFSCPGVGACYLTHYNWELPLHFDLGKEILCYRSTEELIEMYVYYRKRPEDCLKIAQAAWHRSAAEHTWEKRFRKVFREIGFRL